MYILENCQVMPENWQEKQSSVSKIYSNSWEQNPLLWGKGWLHIGYLTYHWNRGSLLLRWGTLHLLTAFPNAGFPMKYYYKNKSKSVF